MVLRQFGWLLLRFMVLVATTSGVIFSAKAMGDFADRPDIRAFLCTLIIVILPVGFFICMAIGKRARKEQLVFEVVGILPHQIDEWKWRKRTISKVEGRLLTVATRIKDLDKEERELLSRTSTPPENILEMDKTIKEALREFREVHDIFEGYEFKLKGRSWNDYVS